jgi:hypothetical protein
MAFARKSDKIRTVSIAARARLNARHGGAAGFGYPTFVPSRGLAISPWETGPLAQPRTLF